MDKTVQWRVSDQHGLCIVEATKDGRVVADFDFDGARREDAEQIVTQHNYGVPRRLRLVCEQHGELSATDIYCQHDAERHVNTVLDAHRPEYGGACTAVVTAFLDDDEHLRSTYHPPMGEMVAG